MPPVSASLDLLALADDAKGDGLNEIIGSYSCNKGHQGHGGGHGGRR